MQAPVTEDAGTGLARRQRDDPSKIHDNIEPEQIKM
jgi:hypothetical protein